MSDGLKRIPAVFYRNDNGKEPVRDWLQELKTEDRRILGKDIATVEYGWPVGMPLCKSLGGGLWEVRSNISDGQIARVIFCIAHGRMILLHAFIKKQQKTPAGDLKTAQQRQKEIEQ